MNLSLQYISHYLQNEVEAVCFLSETKKIDTMSIDRQFISFLLVTVLQKRHLEIVQRENRKKAVYYV